jgi:hypothetical protein
MMVLFWVLAPCRLDVDKPTSLHVAKTEKSIIILTAVKTSNLK